MKIKWNRESALVVLMAVMVLLAMYYFGHKNFVDPIKAEAENFSSTVRAQKSLIDSYPPSEELLAEYIADSKSTEDFLPNGDQFDLALVRLEELAKAADVQLRTVTRNSNQATVAGVPEQFVKNTYSVQVHSKSPSNFRSLIDALMQEERVWNVTTLSYSGNTGSYDGNFGLEIYYFLGGEAAALHPAGSSEPTD